MLRTPLFDVDNNVEKSQKIVHKCINQTKAKVSPQKTAGFFEPEKDPAARTRNH